MDQHIIDAIEKAKLLQETVDKLNAEIGKLLEPIIKTTLAKDSAAATTELLKCIPAGLARDGLMKLHLECMKAYEYRQSLPLEPIHPAVRERMTHIQVEAPAVDKDAQASSPG